MKSPRLICQASIAAFLALVPGLVSAQDTWTGATDANWSVNGNWLDNSEPTLTDAVTFPSPIPVTGGTITLSAGEQALSLNFLESYTLSGGDLSLGGTGSISVDPTFTASIGSALVGVNGLTKAGAGTLILSGLNTYTGPTAINAGTLRLVGGSAIPNASAVTLANAAGVVLDLDGSIETIGSLAGGGTTGGSVTLGAGTLTFGGDNTSTTYAGAITGTAASGLVKEGSGTMILAGVGSGFGGNITINGGTLQAGNAAATQFAGLLGSNTAGRTVTINSGATLNFLGRDTTGGTPNLVKFVINGGTLRNSGGFNRLGSLELNGGTINITGGNSTTFQALTFEGTVKVTGTTASTISGAPTNGAIHLEPAAGVTFDVEDVTGSAAADLTVTSVLTNNSGTAAARALTKIGAGTLFLNGNNAYTGNTNINAGTVDLGPSGQVDGNVVVSNAGSTLRISGGTDALSGDLDVTINAGAFFEYNSTAETFGGLAGAGTITRTAVGTGTLSVNNGGETTTFSGVIENPTGTLALQKNGTGTLTLTGTNTYTGATSMNNGPLVITGDRGAISGSTVVTIGDNNGGGETMTFGAVGDNWALGTLNRLSDSANVTLNGSSSGGFIYNGPANGDATTNVETISTLTASNGRNNVVLIPGTNNEVQITTGTIARANNGTLTIRGDSLGGTGAGSTRLVVTNTTGLLTGAGGADGQTNKSIIKFAVGDATSAGPGSGFVTIDPTTGVRLLTSTEYDTTIAGSNLLRNVSVTGGETVSSDVTINSLRVTGGTTTIDAGDRVTVNSGAILFTDAATIGGGGTLDFGANEGLISIAKNAPAATAVINARLSGTGGLTFSRSGDGSNAIQLGGDNTAIGTALINQGILRLGSSAALNDNAPMTVIGRPNSILQLNGFNATVKDLQASSGTLVIQNGSSTTPATLTTYLTANRNFQTGTPFQNGGTAALNMIVSGGSTLTVDQDASATGSYEQRVGTTQLSGSSGTLNDFISYAINGGTLTLSNSNTANNTNRLRDASPIAFNAGTLNFDNGAQDASFSETVGVATLNSGASTITVDRATTTNSRTSVLTLSGLARNPGATVNFTSQSAGTNVFDLGTTAQSRLVITGQTAGFIGGWATIDSSASTREFAKYVTAGTVSVTALVAGDYVTTLPGATTGQNVKITATPAVLGGATTINSLNVQQASATTVDLGTNTLRLESGGLIVSGAFNSAINNGTLTAGPTVGTGGDLILHAIGPFANPVDINATIADNGGGVVNLVKTGAGQLQLDGVANTYTGKTFLTGGNLRINNDNNLGNIGADSGFFIGNSSTLDVIDNVTLNSARAITVGAGTANIISIGAGTAGNGKTLTYNGSINSVAGTEGSLRFRSNLASATPDTGDFVGNLSALNIGGTFTLDSGTVTVSAASNTIGRGLLVGTEGVGSITYNSAGGSLTVGQGINATDALDIGIVNTDFTPTNTFIGTSTLDVSALSNFTANSDVIRIGVSSGNRWTRGVLLGATNNDITALTSITIAHAPGASAVGQNSTIALGSGTNNITTPTFVVGSLKGEGSVTIANGGVLNVGGFGANTQNLFVARNNGSTGTVNVGNFNATGGTVNGSFNAVSIGEKTGGGVGGSAGTMTLTGSGNSISANSLSISSVAGNASGTSLATNGTLNFGGGSFVVNNDVAMATIGTNTSTTPTSTGRLNITGGTFTIGGDITRTTGDEARSNSFINVDGGTLDLQNQAFGDTTAGTITASQLAFRSGSIADVAGATLTATSSTNSGIAGTAGDALILRDTTIGFNVSLTGATAGNVHYEAAGGGAGGSISGNISLGTVNRTFNVEDSAGSVAELIVSGAISGAVNINKTGAGALLLNNTVEGGVNVTGGTLGGTGPIGGPVTVGSGTTLAPGASIGPMSTGALTLSANSTFQLEINSTTVQSDLVAASGSLTLNEPVTLSISDLGNSVLAENTPLTFITYNGTWNGGLFTVAGNTIDDDTESFVVGANTFTIDYNRNGNSVALVAIPEPGSAAILFAGLGSLLGLQRFRRRLSCCRGL